MKFSLSLAPSLGLDCFFCNWQHYLWYIHGMNGINGCLEQQKPQYLWLKRWIAHANFMCKWMNVSSKLMDLRTSAEWSCWLQAYILPSKFDVYLQCTMHDAKCTLWEPSVLCDDASDISADELQIHQRERERLGVEKVLARNYIIRGVRKAGDNFDVV